MGEIGARRERYLTSQTSVSATRIRNKTTFLAISSSCEEVLLPLFARHFQLRYVPVAFDNTSQVDIPAPTGMLERKRRVEV